MRIAVISDIHCHKHEPNVPKGGYYFPLMPDSPAKQNPFAALKKFINANGIVADYILSPGDYSHQIDPDGLKSSWEQLKLLTKEFEANYLLGTIGNHDVESRKNEKGPFNLIKSFDSDFPVYKSSSSKTFRNNLLTETYFEFIDNGIHFIIMNSSFDHWDTHEARKGKVDLEKLEEIKQIIENSTSKYKLVLIHHHPVVHETGIGDTGDLIHGSEEFLKTVDGVDFIVHGHKHDFRFSQLQLKPKNQSILGAGSFSCFITGKKPLALNSFQIIQFNQSPEANCINHGTVETYTYSPNEGWKYEPEFQEGFGNTSSLEELKTQLREFFAKTVDPYTSWQDIVEDSNSLNHISSSLRNKALSQLMEESDIKRVTFDKYTKYPIEIIIR